MSKKNREKRASEVESPAGAGGGGMAWLPTVLALGALGLAFVAWTDAKRTRDELTKRIVSIDQRLIQTQTQVASARPKPPQQQGPDPSKVYTVRLDGSPYRGNPTAPIVIAEFSDYQ
ncbi:MAG TPA: hypothetical protein VFB67_09700 [Candidatus Polarisedimenticolaceae bacterium]|nr:hypothetical protein [Candidatus Polarisedimenticolaceae bacterium]